jgi:hypothetical protein
LSTNKAEPKAGESKKIDEKGHMIDKKEEMAERLEVLMRCVACICRSRIP